MKCAIQKKLSSPLGAVLVLGLLSSRAGAQEPTAPKAPPKTAETPAAKANQQPGPESEPADESKSASPEQDQPTETNSVESTEKSEAATEEAAAAEATAAEATAEQTAAAEPNEAAAETGAEKEAASQPPSESKTPASETSPAPKPASADKGVALAEEEGYHGASDKGLVEAEDPPAKLSFDVMVDLTIPLGKTADFVSKAGLQGFAVSFRYYITNNIGVGAGAAFDGLSSKDAGTTQYDELTITGIHTRQISFTPLLVKAFYAFRGKGNLEPYVAVGVGAAMSSQRLVTGYSAFSDNNWHFATAPEVGVHFDIGQLVLLGAARLNYLPASGGSVSHTFANISLGVAIQ